MSTDLVADEVVSMRVALVRMPPGGADRAIAIELAWAGFFAYATGRRCDVILAMLRTRQPNQSTRHAPALAGAARPPESPA